MIEKMAERFNWWLSFYGTLGAVIVFLPKMITGNDIETFLATLVIAAFVSLALLVVAIRKIRRQSLSVVSMLVVYCAVSWLLFKVSDDVRTDGRWFVQSKGYKTKVLAQPGSPNGELKHVEWEGWGFAGSGDTTVYLVFDPHDSLATVAKSHSPGKFNGIPCEAFRVRRLESNWYTVLFYTDTDWDHCN